MGSAGIQMQEHEGSHSVLSHASARVANRSSPSSVGVDLGLRLLHVIDVLLLSHSGHTRGPCTPSPQASRAWRASHHAKIVMYPFSMISPPKIAGKGHPGSRPWAGGPGLTPAARWALDPKIVGPCAASKIPQIFALGPVSINFEIRIPPRKYAVSRPSLAPIFVKKIAKNRRFPPLYFNRVLCNSKKFKFFPYIPARRCGVLRADRPPSGWAVRS